MRIMGIDPGTQCTGISIIDFEKDKKEICFVETIHAEKLAKNLSFIEEIHGSRYVRIQATADQVQKLMIHYRPNLVISESPYMGKFANSFAALTQLISEIRSRVFRFDNSICFQMIDPATVKKFMGVSGKSGDKDLMQAALIKRQLLYSETIDLSMLDEHSIDSICIALYGIDKITRA